MNSLQNYMLFSSDRGGMRIEYAKQKMGELNARDAGLMNNNSMPNNCNNLANNCANNAAGANHHPMSNSIAAAHGALAHHLNNVPYTPVTTVANHVNNHVTNNHVNHQTTKSANQQQANSLNNNLNSMGANVSIVNCNSPAAQQLAGQQNANSVVMVGGQEANVNGAITITPILSSTVEQMEMVTGLEQCQYMLMVDHADGLIHFPYSYA